MRILVGCAVKFSVSGVPSDTFGRGQPVAKEDEEDARRVFGPWSRCSSGWHPGRMRKCEGQSGPAAPDSLADYTTVGLECQENNIIKCSWFERMGMSLVLLRVQAVEICG